jgi:hypothetical protein
MLYREIIAVCSQIHTKHINTLCGQNVELPNVKLVVYIVSAGSFLYQSQSPVFKVWLKLSPYALYRTLHDIP